MLPRWVERCGSWVVTRWQRVAGRLSRAPRDVLDTDVREVFLAEFEELTVDLKRLLPDLRSDPTTLPRLRRAFHTLKGSGLMAGAPNLAGICSSLERLAVQLVEKRLALTDDVFETFRQAITLLPGCRRALEAGVPLPAAMQAVGQRATHQLGGR